MSSIGDILDALCEMSRSPSEVEAKITNKAEELIQHLAKCYLWRDTRDLDDWKSEVWSKLDRVYSTKSKSKFPKQEKIYKWMLADNEPALVNEVHKLLLLTRAGKKYEGEPVKSLGPNGWKDIVEFFSDYMWWLSGELSVRGRVSPQDVYKKLDELLAKHPIPKN